MRENVDLTSSIYRTTGRAAAVDSTITVDAAGGPSRQGRAIPGDLDEWYLNSVTGLLCCCYMDALGKVTLQGKQGYRLNTFAQRHMPDLVAECTAKGGSYSLQTLYTVYRNGFVHQFASSTMAWSRRRREADYWFEGTDRKPGLNVDRLADGVVKGIEDFEARFRTQVSAGSTTFENFFEWLDARS